MIAAWRAAMAFDSRPRLGEIRCPTLVLAGAADTAVPMHHARQLHEGIAHSRLVAIDGADHADDLDRSGPLRARGRTPFCEVVIRAGCYAGAAKVSASQPCSLSAWATASGAKACSMASRSSSVKPLTIRHAAAGDRRAQRRRGAAEQRAGEVAEDDVGHGQGLGEQVAVAHLDAPGGDRVERDVRRRRVERVAVVVDAHRVRGAEPRGGNREDAGSGADVDDGAAGERRPLQRRQAQPRRFVVARAEAHRRLDHDGERIGVPRRPRRARGRRRRPGPTAA